jgi:predicted MPP superfamily phosphohydrolase
MLDKQTAPNRPASPARRRLIGSGLAVAALGATGAGTAYGLDTDDLRVERREIALPGWPAEADGLRVGYLSDFHCDSSESVRLTERAVGRLLAERPHVALLGGDYISIHARKWVPRAAAALAPLAAVPAGVFAVLGNHDWWSGGHSLVNRELIRAGFDVLNNRSVPFPGAPGVWLVGLDDLCVDKQDAPAALAGVPHDAVKILLIHEPDYADQSPPGFALQLSGHSHGGQIRIPGISVCHCPRYGRHYPEGLLQGPNHPVYTSRGIGTIGPPFRLFCPPEVTLLTMRSASAKNT